MMSRKKGIALAVIIAVAIAASVIVTVSFYYLTNNNNAPIPNGGNNSGRAAPLLPNEVNGTREKGSLQKIPVSVLSSPSALPFVEKWAAQYNSERNLGDVNVNYSDRADDTKISVLFSNFSSFLADHSADLVISSRPVATKGNFTYAGSLFLPVSPQAVTVVYNIPSLPDVPSGLRLDPILLYKVLSGSIRYWDDTGIKSLNPDMNLPHKQIVVVHEGSTGSATDLLGRYLASVSNGTISWPRSSLAADSGNSLSAMVRQTPYSIGYVDFAFAIQTRMTYASLKNSDGQYFMPSTDSISAALRNGTMVNPALITDTSLRNSTVVMPPIVSVGQLGNGSYPVVGFYYAAFADRTAGLPANETAMHGKDAAIMDVLRWIAGKEGQQIIKDMQYPSVYSQSKQLESFADKVLGATVTGSPTKRSS
jgi:phosphate transport system substrate-binding protein